MRRLLRGRVYGADNDHPGPRPHRDYAELVGGPLDGLLLDITGWTADEIRTGVALMTELGNWRWRPCPVRPAARRAAPLGLVRRHALRLHQECLSGELLEGLCVGGAVG